jgi:hypothetical protein
MSISASNTSMKECSVTTEDYKALASELSYILSLQTHTARDQLLAGGAGWHP